MTKQYNVNIVGSITNTNGVLSGFSSSNYATFKAFAAGANPYEMVFKFNSNNVAGDGTLFYLGRDTQGVGRLSLEVAESKMYLFFSIDGAGVFDIWTSTILQDNTDYWVKIIYNGSSEYQIYLSTNGETYTLEGTKSSSYRIADTNNEISYLGIYGSSTNYSLDGTIDLNECYIKIDGTLWWRGVDNITKIQLRHDTAANWTSVNPVLLEGEVGIETDTKKQKIGDGSTPWNSLAYDLGSTALQSNTTVIDGQWVQSQSVAGTSVAKGTYNISLSSYLPNDGYVYEVLVNLRAYSSNTSNAGDVSVYSDIFGKTTYNTSNIKGQGGAGGNSRQIGNTFILPVGTGRTITYEIEDYNITSLDLVLWGYRRIGTNS